MGGKSGRPRKLLPHPTATSSFVRKLQAAYIAAGQPELRALATKLDIGRITLRDLLIEGKTPESVWIFEELCNAFGLKLSD